MQECRLSVSPEEFATRFTASFRRLWLTAVGILHDATTAEDVVQESAVIALGKLEQFKPGTSFQAWMGQIVRFTALNHARRRKSRGTQPADPVDLAETTVAESAVPTLSLTKSGRLPALQEHFDDQVLEGLEGLAPIARTCLLLRVVEGLGYEEISELLEIPKGTAMSHVHRARKSLRTVLSEERA